MPDEEQVPPGTRAPDESSSQTTRASAAATVQRLEDFTRAAADWVWETDRHHNYTHLSEGFTRILGVPAQSMLGGYVFQLTHFRNVDESIMEIVGDMREHRPFRNRLVQVTDAQGKALRVLLCGIPFYQVPAGAFRGYRGTALDISDRASAAQAFPEDLGRIQDVIDLAADWFWEADQHHRIIWLSESYSDVTGLSLSKSLGRDLRTLWLRDDADAAPDSDAGTLPDRAIFRQRSGAWCVADAERTTQFLISGKPLFDNMGLLEGYRGVGLRLDLRQPVETPLREEPSAESVGNAAGSIKAVFGEAPAAKSEGQKKTDRLAAEAEQDATPTVTSDLPASMRAATSQDERTLLTDVSEVIETTLQRMWENAEEAGIVLSGETETLMPCLRIDKQALLQILVSLTGNAIDQAPPSGRVTLHAESTGNGGLAVAVDISRAATAMPTNVTHLNSKVPVAPEERDNALLGMATARSMIEEQGGELRFLGDSENGARAVVTFPPERVVQEHEDPDTWKILF